MSIITNQHFDIPSYENGFEYAIPGKAGLRRRFFHTVARWDVRAQKVVIPGQEVLSIPNLRYHRRAMSTTRTPRHSEDVVDGEESSAEDEDEAMDASDTEDDEVMSHME